MPSAIAVSSDRRLSRCAVVDSTAVAGTAAGVAVMELAGYINEHFQRAAETPQDNLLADLATARAAGELG